MTSDLWSITLPELRLQMTTATFDTWLRGSHQVSLDGDELVISVINDYAADWLQHRLYDVIHRTVTAVSGGHDYKITFRVEDVRARTSDQPDGAPLALTPPPAPPVFPGFEPIRANFTQVPRQFFEIVLRSEPPVVTAFVAAVVDQTHGVIINYHTGERREWWEASHEEIGRVAGIKSKASVIKAVAASRANGYVIHGDGHGSFRYRLRRIGEPVDWIKK